VVGKFVGGDEADAARPAVWRNEVGTGDFGFFTAIEAKGRNFQRFAVSTKNCAAAL